MAKKVFPIHLDEREREILQLMSQRRQCSMAEVIRRLIRSCALDEMKPRGLDAATAPMESASV